jgi:DNA-directed RNA polymerase specialized sigma24 family protein
MDAAADTPAPIATLLENHRAFLRYLECRVGDRALAEDSLQEAFAKVVARPEQAPNDEAIVPWFYRTLRNAAIDQFRGVVRLTGPMKRLRASSRRMKHQPARWRVRSARASPDSRQP